MNQDASQNESTDTAIDWSQLYQLRRATQKRYRSIWQVPLRKRHHQVVREYSKDITQLLEMGAGSRNFFDLMQKHYPQMNYKSFDVDRSGHHDFYSLDEIEGEYDSACMFEVIEHISPQLALQTVRKAHQHLKPGGLFFVTTPNTFNPPEYLRDATHITPWCYDELGGILQLGGFELLEIYRLHQDPLIPKILKRYVFAFLFRLLGIDYSTQVIAIGRKA